VLKWRLKYNFFRVRNQDLRIKILKAIRLFGWSFLFEAFFMGTPFDLQGAGSMGRGDVATSSLCFSTLTGDEIASPHCQPHSPCFNDSWLGVRSFTEM
jgi:hypothetical protein